MFGWFEKKAEPKYICSFCGLNNEQVAKLITGPNVAICDRCVRLCSDVVVDSVPEGLPEKRVLSHVIAELSVAPYAQIRRLVAAGLALGPTLAELRAMTRHAGIWDHATGIELTERIPGEERTPFDVLQLASWHMTLEQPAVALKLLEALPEGATELETLHCRIDRAGCALAFSDGDIEAHVAEIDEALAALAALPEDPDWAESRAYIRRRGWIAQARAWAHTGQTAEAEALLDAFLEERPQDASALWPKAQIREAVGDSEGASALVAMVVEGTHPESLLGKRARAWEPPT